MTQMQARPALPPLLTVPEAARVLGIGRTLAYRLVRDEWPTPIVRTERLIKIPSAPLLHLLEVGTALPAFD